MPASLPCHSDALRDSIDILTARVAAVEQRADALAAAGRAWRVVAQIGGELLLGTDAGDLARVPVDLARVLAAGRALDVTVRDVGNFVELVDRRDVVVARLTRAALLALPRALQGWARDSRGSPTGSPGALAAGMSAQANELSLGQGTPNGSAATS